MEQTLRDLHKTASGFIGEPHPTLSVSVNELRVHANDLMRLQPPDMRTDLARFVRDSLALN